MIFGNGEAVAGPTQHFLAARVPQYGVTVAFDEIGRVVHTMEHIGNDIDKNLVQLSSELAAVQKMTLQIWMGID